MTLTDYITRRSTPAAPAPVVTGYGTDSDTAYRAAWGLSIAEWSVLTDSQRADYRDRVVYAPHFTK